MGKNLKILIALAVISISGLFMNSFTAYAQDFSDISSMLPEGKTAEFYITQAESIQQYNQLLHKLGVESENSFRSQAAAGKAKYDDCFGGAYLNENGELVVLLTSDTAENRKRIREYTGNPGIITESCKFSYNELTEVIGTINSHLDELLERGADLGSMYRDVMNNCIVIKVRDLNEYKEAEIRKVVDSGCMVIRNTDEEIEYQSGRTSDTKGGHEIINTSTSGTATLGFGAVRNGVKGYVTASHFCRSIGQQVSYDGTVIGTVKQSGYYPNSYADAAFIESNGAMNPTSAFMGGYYCTAASTTEYPQNTSILMYGKVSGMQSGTIYYYDYTYVPLNKEYITVTDHVAAKYKSAQGDSGAPVFIYTGWNNGRHTCTLIGTHTASTFHAYDEANSVFCKYGNIVRMLNVTAITE